MSTRHLRQGVHEALRPLYLACVEELDRTGVAREHPDGVRVTTCESLGGAAITRTDDETSVSITVSGEFVLPGSGTEEEVDITFADDMRDLSDSRVDSTLRGTIGLRDYRRYARDMMSLVRPE